MATNTATAAASREPLRTSKKERKQTPEGWEDGTLPLQRDFKVLLRGRDCSLPSALPRERDTALGAERPRLRPCASRPSVSAPLRSGPMALGVEQARPPPPPIGARPTFERPPGAPRGLLMAVVKWAPASAGGAGCPGCGRLLQTPGMGTAPKNCPPAAYSTASQPLPPPQGLYYDHIAPPPTGSRAGARRVRLGVAQHRHLYRILSPNIARYRGCDIVKIFRRAGG